MILPNLATKQNMKIETLSWRVTLVFGDMLKPEVLRILMIQAKNKGLDLPWETLKDKRVALSHAILWNCLFVHYWNSRLCELEELH